LTRAGPPAATTEFAQLQRREFQIAPFNKCPHTGGVGTAKVVKIVNNMMSMGNVLVAAEALMVQQDAVTE
jgi:3-hydroxyisobutyrate dehydrogenase-like beta-hydroxyacid dehydrogenase